MHKSVGALIRNGDEILMMDRVNPPFGWACSAGHIEENEKPEEALIRETKEELGIDVLEYKLLIHEFVEWNECKKGVKGHDWYVFEVLKWEGELKEKDKEAKIIKWLNVKELKNLNIEKVWQLWFKKLKII